MNSPSRLGACALALVLLAAPTLARAALELTIEVTTTVELSEADKAAGHASAKPRTESAAVLLGPSYFSYTTTAVRLIYDFANRRVYTIDPATGTYTNDSLYADIGFRSSDFSRRVAAGEFKADPLQRVIMEQRYGLQDTTGGTDTLTASHGPETRYAWRNKELLAWSGTGAKVAAAEMGAFIRFYRYRFGGHPQALAALAKLDAMPSAMRFSNYDAGRRKTVALKVVSSRLLPDAPYSLTGLTFSPEDDPQVDDIYAASSDTAARTAALLDLGTTYYTGGNTLSAWAAWDTARSANPNAPGLKTVDEIQEKLVADHPEFF